MPGYMETRPYGKAEGLADRLRQHVHELGHDKLKPWLGMGLVDDLLAAADVLDGKRAPAKSIPPYSPPPPAHNPEIVKEYDL